MRKKYISQENLEDIIRLVKLGASWLRIQTETGIPRRSAKLAYEEYLRSELGGDLKAARQQVVSEQFNTHMHDTISLAQLVSSCIGEPAVRDKRTFEEVMSEIMKIDVRTNRIRSPLSGNTTFSELVIRQNKILFQSLKVHTGGKIDWKILDEWGTARNIWINNYNILTEEAGIMINNLIKGKQSEEIIKDNMKLIDNSEIADGIVNATVGAILNGTNDKVKDLVQIITAREMCLTFS